MIDPSTRQSWITFHTSIWDTLYFTRNDNGISDLGLTLQHFEFLSLYLDMFDQNWSFFHKNEYFDQTYLNTASKTQNVEELNLDLIFHSNFW